MEGSKLDRSSQLTDMVQTSTEARDTAETFSSSAAGKSHMPRTAKTAGLRAGFFTGEATSYLRSMSPVEVLAARCCCHHLFCVKPQHSSIQQQCRTLQHVGRLHAPHQADLFALLPSVGAGAAKARASGKAKRSSTQKAESGNGIVDVSDDGSEEPYTTSRGAHSGACQLLCALHSHPPCAGCSSKPAYRPVWVACSYSFHEESQYG